MRKTILLAMGAALMMLSAAPADAASYGYCSRYASRVSANWAPPAPEGAFVGGAVGAIGGAVFGGIVGGSKGAGAGALIGAGVGAVAGAAKNERKHRKIYDRAFADCMAGRVR